ncbi:MAG: putative sulfate exporter family transporter, partial [Termitinemataceae bacterium]
MHLREKLNNLWPGVFLAIGVAAVSLAGGSFLGQIIPWTKNLISPTLVAILLGCAIRSLLQLPPRFHAGISWGIKTVLRAGIVLMGIRLSILSIFKIGAFAIGLVTLCITTAVLVTMVFARWSGISKRLAALIAAGTSICGVSAILSIAPAIEADQEEVSYAVVIITLVGLTATLLYPYFIEMVLGLSVIQAGYFIGTAVHDTSQVTATGLMYNQLWKHTTEAGLTGLDIALTTKLVRNTFMVFIIPLITVWFRFRSVNRKEHEKMKLLSIIPLFVIGYLCMGLFRTLGDILFIESSFWTDTQKVLTSLSTYLIMIAVASIGLSTNLRKLGHWGVKPLLTGIAA